MSGVNKAALALWADVCYTQTQGAITLNDLPKSSEQKIADLQKRLAVVARTDDELITHLVQQARLIEQARFELMKIQSLTHGPEPEKSLLHIHKMCGNAIARLSVHANQSQIQTERSDGQGNGS